MPAAELIVMIDPPLPASIIGGTTALMVFHRPVRLMSRTSCHCSAEISHSRPQFSTPALATTMSRGPNCSIEHSPAGQLIRVDVPGVVHHVVQVVDGDRRHGELAAVAPQPPSRPGVVGH